MPYWDGETFHLFYLLDRAHHAEQAGLGGHQWAHASTRDLVNWTHYPLALPVGTPGSVDQHGICTGSIFKHEGLYHAFYATRLKAEDGRVSEVLCRAVSRDLIHFDKSPDNPLFAAPPGYDAGNLRDPFVFQHAETGTFHMLVTASRGGRGVLAHFTSEDLNSWALQEPFLVGRDGHSPECPEHFFWNGWWYLIYSHDGQLEYRISREPLGPWESAARETIEPVSLKVPRTAEFTGGRRLAVGFLPWREDCHDSGNFVYAGNVVFRELLQGTDGTLTTRFVPEMMPPTGPGVEAMVTTLPLTDIPHDCTVTLRIVPSGEAGEFGLLLRADARLKSGYQLRIAPDDRRVTLQSWPVLTSAPAAVLSDVCGLDKPLEITICLQGSVIDVCVNGQRTLIERGFDHHGTHLGFFASEESARLESVRIAPIL